MWQFGPEDKSQDITIIDHVQWQLTCFTVCWLCFSVTFYVQHGTIYPSFKSLTSNSYNYIVTCGGNDDGTLQLHAGYQLKDTISLDTERMWMEMNICGTTTSKNEFLIKTNKKNNSTNEIIHEGLKVDIQQTFLWGRAALDAEIISLAELNFGISKKGFLWPLPLMLNSTNEILSVSRAEMFEELKAQSACWGEGLCSTEAVEFVHSTAVEEHCSSAVCLT